MSVTTMPGPKRAHPFPDHPKCSRPTFDLFMVEDCFPKTRPTSEAESQLLTAILKRNTDLTPTLEEQTHIAALVSQVQAVLETMSLDPQSASVFDEFRVVGSYKKGTMIRGKNEADIVLILRQNPTAESISNISEKVSEELMKTSPGSSFAVTVTDYGFCVNHVPANASVRILMTTQIGSMRKAADGQQQPQSVIPFSIMQKHMSAIRHVRWFEDSASGGAYKVLIRVLKDIVQRFQGLHVLNKWTIDVLAHYSISFLRTDTTLPLNQALRRLFQLLAGGLFLPGSAGIPDPCENGAVSLHSSMTQKQQDRLCMTAQTIVRIMPLAHGYEILLGLRADESGILEKECELDGVLIRAHAPVIGIIEPDSRQEAPVPAESMDTPAETSAADVKEEDSTGETSNSNAIFAQDDAL